MITRLDHVAVAVWDMEASLVLYRDLLGGAVCQAGAQEDFGIAAIQLEFGTGLRLELISPSHARPQWLVKFLERQGEGLHHVTFASNDIAADSARLRTAGFVVIDERYDDPRWQESFISPRSANRVLIQLASSCMTLPEQDSYFTSEGGLDAVLSSLRDGNASPILPGARHPEPSGAHPGPDQQGAR